MTKTSYPRSNTDRYRPPMTRKPGGNHQPNEDRLPSGYRPLSIRPTPPPVQQNSGRQKELIEDELDLQEELEVELVEEPIEYEDAELAEAAAFGGEESEPVVVEADLAPAPHATVEEEEEEDIFEEEDEEDGFESLAASASEQPAVERTSAAPQPAPHDSEPIISVTKVSEPTVAQIRGGNESKPRFQSRDSRRESTKQPGTEPAQVRPLRSAETTRRPAASQEKGMTLDGFIQKHRSVPTRTVALGYCDDGLPVLFDLTDDRTGPVLVLGDPSSGKTNLMKVLLRTAVAFNAPHEVKLLMLSARPEEYKQLNEQTTRSGHSLGLYKNDSGQAAEWIMRMGALVERRLTSRQINPPVLMIFDDIEFMAKSSSDVRLNFEWILKHGPSVQVWPVGVLTAEAAQRMPRWNYAFNTRILGSMPNSMAEKLGTYEGLVSEDLQLGKDFAVYVNDNWLKFSIPEI